LEFEYLGEYPHLFSVAINSILGARGFIDIGWGVDPPSIFIQDEDNYGRILFEYYERFSGYNRIIMQKVDEDYVYFYPYYNFILLPSEYNTIRARNKISQELKEINSWNQPISDDSEFVRVRIVRRKEEGPIKDDELVEIYQLFYPEVNLSRSQMLFNTVFLRTDRYNRSIYLLGRYAILFQPNHLFDIENGVLEITDWFNYQTELRLFMEANGWDTPFEGQLENEDEWKN
jgi:hypothetical protein